MHIWYLNHYAGSKSSPREGRSYFLARSIKNNGSKCSVIGASFHHLQSGDVVRQDNKIEKKNVDDIPFVWFKTPRYQGSGFSRIINMLSYSYSCLRYDLVKLGVLEKPDVVVVTSVHPFHVYSGYRLAKKYQAKFVFEVRDLWPLSLNVLLGLPNYHPLSLVLSILEKFGYKNADLVSSVLPNAMEYMKSKGVKNKDFIYLPNGFIPGYLWSENNIHEKELAQIRNRYKRVVMHTGSMGKPNGLELIISAANEMKNNSDIAFVFVGGGALKQELIEKSCSEHIYFFEPVARNQVQSVLSYSDICFCGSQDLSELYKFGISPNKVFDYMYAKKFVLLAIDSPNNPVEDSDCGVCIRPNSVTSLKRTLEDSAKLSDEKLKEFGERGFRYLLKHHDFDNLAQKLLHKLESL